MTSIKSHSLSNSLKSTGSSRSNYEADEPQPSTSRPDQSLFKMMHTRNLNKVIARYERLARDDDYDGNQACVNLAELDDESNKASKSMVETSRKQAKVERKKHSSMIVKGTSRKGKQKRSVEECERMFFDLIRQPQTSSDTNDEDEDEDEDEDDEEEMDNEEEEGIDKEEDLDEEEDIGSESEDLEDEQLQEQDDDVQKSKCVKGKNTSEKRRSSFSDEHLPTNEKLTKLIRIQKAETDVSSVPQNPSYLFKISPAKTQFMSTPKHSLRNSSSAQVSYTKQNTKKPNTKSPTNANQSKSNNSQHHHTQKSSLGSTGSDSEISDPVSSEPFIRINSKSNHDLYANSSLYTQPSSSNQLELIPNNQQIASKTRLMPQVLDASYQLQRMNELIQVLQQNNFESRNLTKHLVDRVLRVLHRTTLPKPNEVQPFFHFAPNVTLQTDDVSVTFLFIQSTHSKNHFWSHLTEINFGQSLLELYRFAYQIIYTWFS